MKGKERITDHVDELDDWAALALASLDDVWSSPADDIWDEA